MSGRRLVNSRVGSAPVSRTLLLVDLGLRVQVQAQDENVGQDVESTDCHQDIGVFKGNLLGQLHHHQDDGQVGTVKYVREICVFRV